MIWLLFSKDRASNGWVKHLLCQGFQRDISARSVHHGENAASGIPGVLSVHPNDHVISIKTDPWPHVLALMGKEGERAMIDLLLDCGIFLLVESGRGIYYQLSGGFENPGVLLQLTRKAILWVIYIHCRPKHHPVQNHSLLRSLQRVHPISHSCEIE